MQHWLEEYFPFFRAELRVCSVLLQSEHQYGRTGRLAHVPKITRYVSLSFKKKKISGEHNRGVTRAAFCTPWDQNVQGV
jgi:hypothetical protein